MPPFRFLFPAGLLAALASPALAQTAPADTARFYRHHLGLTASPVLDHFFTANRSLPVGLLYKHQSKPNRLWRYGLVLNQDYSRQDDYRPDYSPVNIKLNPEYRISSFGVSASIGREYTRRFARRWTGTAGADLEIGFSQYTNRHSYQQPGTPIGTPGTEVVDSYRNRYYQASLMPFVGMRFHLWPQFYASAESTVRLYYLRNAENPMGYTTDLSTGKIVSAAQTEAQVTQQNVSLSYRLINQVTVHYLLGPH